ncbi:MAG: nuclear transport factor 2 family protein [Deltaproteobacteria bacterium]|nr:nuclear transport factor 2 family protein [Deltaproteobacteria bacterium]NND30646.1 nuclear transport factor 2 family protein [Myxococcales bacterium]MBT8465753.1 nuclear transport factor 2 family protein [Deltaproteobacteria bacterium]MBT8482139.1 nuclear transport factor 2 family protein [Deltaproteobacteria bacterium]NNK08261.1 nuclear transport factor 2 family protein [Myxococcales bacterium]
MGTPAIDTWHQLIEERNAAGLDEILADDAVFHSPVVHTPQRGKALTKLYLSAAIMVLGGNEFEYVREVIGESDAVLEFTANVDGIIINGVDMVHWNEDGKIDDFKVMVRPLKAVNLLHGLMKQMLGQMG